MNMQVLIDTAQAELTTFGTKALGAVAVWIVVRWLISLAACGLGAALGLYAYSPDNGVTIVGNNKIFSDTIQNYPTNPYRRVKRTAQLAHSVDVHEAIARLKDVVARIRNVEAEPAPDVEVIDFNAMGPVLAVRPYESLLAGVLRYQ